MDWTRSRRSVRGVTASPGSPTLVSRWRDVVEAGAARADDQHALVLRDEGADRVDDRLRAAGARAASCTTRRVAGRDLRDHVLLRLVGVEQEGVGGGRALVLADGLDRVERGSRPSCGRSGCRRAASSSAVSRSRASSRSAGATSAKEETTSRGCTLNQGRWRGEPAQPVDHRLRLEDAALRRRARRTRRRRA